MSGKIISLLIILIGILAGIGVYYSQVYAFYHPVSEARVMLTAQVDDQPEPIAFHEFTAIDANSSPIRYRACFQTTQHLADLTHTYVPAPQAQPHNAPHWFDCFDADAIAAQLENGTARAFLGTQNISYGVDRIVAITNDGRGYVWHELNNCGTKAYDGSIIGEECPKRDQN